MTLANACLSLSGTIICMNKPKFNGQFNDFTVNFDLNSRELYLDAVGIARSASVAYYQSDDTLMDDISYDSLLRAISIAEDLHPEWVDTLTAGAVAAGALNPGVAKHAEAMLSLDNVFSAVELTVWCQSRLNQSDVTAFVVEPKFDGLSLAATYRQGKLVRLATRGDGHAGEDVTHAHDRINGLPGNLNDDVDVEIRGEVLFTNSDFAAANVERINSGKSPYVNARNAASGALRADKLDYEVTLSFFAHGQVGLNESSHLAAMNKLNEYGVTTASSVFGFTIGNLLSTVNNVETIQQQRSSLPFEIDGAVVKVDSKSEQEQLGSSSRAPRWGIAVKFPAEEAFGLVSSIDVQIGRLGTITPVAKLSTAVFVGGTNISSITLHNFEDLARRNIRVGDTVVLRRAGDVIPEIVGAVLSKRPLDSTPFSPPTICPRCGDSIDFSQSRWRCSRGRKCGLAESIAYAASRDVLDIEGLGEKVINQLVDRGLLSDVSDIFSLDVHKLTSVDRVGATSAQKILEQIHLAKSQPLSRVFAALGVRMTGRSMSRRLAGHFGSMTELRAAGLSDLCAIEGVGPERAAAIISDLSELSDVIDKLANHGVNFIEANKKIFVDSPLKNKSVVITGNLGKLTRIQAQEAVEQLGGNSTTSLSSKTDILIIGDAPGSSKIDKAEQLGLVTMSSIEFFSLLNTFNLN